MNLIRNSKTYREICHLARELSKDNQISVYLYGSRARGESSVNSDWDILILTNDELHPNESFEKFAFPFTEIGWKLGEQITPLIYTKSEWAAEQNTSFYLNVINDAIRL